jgi:uncharacterized protein YcbK (DUF882 family)
MKRADLDCQCGCVAPPRVRARQDRLWGVLVGLQSMLGVKLQVNSGYRCVARHKAVYAEMGLPPKMGSRHLYGDAADLWVDGWSGVKLAGRIIALIKAGRLEDGGIGTYRDRPSICHYDLRGKAARW